MDKKVFDELMNRGIITNVGLNAEDYNSIADLQKFGIATGIDASIEYNEIMDEIANSEESAEALTEFFNMVAAGGNVVVPMNIVLDAPLTITKDVVLDLNGCTLKSATDVFDVSAKLTINGDGKIFAATDNTCSWCAVFAHDNADVTINGGEYSVGAPKGDYNDLIYAKDNAKITINGGMYHSAGTVRKDGTAFVLNLKDKSNAKIAVTAGKFENFNPAAANTEPGDLYSFVADGHESVADGDWFVVKETEIVVDDETNS